MTVECPVCRTANDSESPVCVKCATPFGLDAATIAIGEHIEPPPTDATVVAATIVTPPGGFDTVHTPSSELAGGEKGAAGKAPLVPGSVLAGRYQILQVLGEGGMGAVYKARDREVDRTVAIKVVRPELSGHPEIMRRFKQELVLARQVTHRNVIRIFDIGVADGRRFITMEFIEGKTLQSLLTEKGKLPVDQATDIIRQTLLGLDAAHSEGVVHRDLKPQNIMVDSAGRVFLMDFGIAKSLELAGMTRTGVLMGTPDYMSPEQAKGERADARSDLFTVGVIFFELLTGQQPYRSETVMQTLVKRTKERATPTRELDPSIPQTISDIVSKCLEIDPDQRYQSAGQILRALDPGSLPTPKESDLFYLGMEAGTSFGPRYRIEGLIGEGGMGKVYSAYDKDLDRLIALKLVRPELANDPVSMDRLKQELLLASKISHKNIVRIHDLGDVNGVKFISMAYVDGEDLEAVIRRKIRLSVERATHLAKQICRGLDAAHHEGVLHRDLKPQNILIDKQDSAFILDFGLARSIQAGAAMAGELTGTPRYMSPEQAEGLPIDVRSDVYAVGLIMYEMVTGALPFSSDTVMQAMFQRVTQAPKDPKLLNPDLPDYFVNIMMKCLEKDPAKRYQTANELLKALEAEVPAAPSAVTFRLPSRRILAAIALLVVAIALGIVRIPAVHDWLFPNATESGANAKYVGVLPFNVTGDASQLGYLAQGIADSLSAKLAQVKDVHVTSSPYAISRLKEGPTPIEKMSVADIAHSLGAKTLVTGSIQASGDHLEVVVNLDGLPGKEPHQSRVFPGVTQDVLSLENDIYGYLVKEIGVTLSNEEMASASTRATTDAAAYDIYLRAQNSVRTKRDVESLKMAVEQFKRAAEKDPSFALAYAGIADNSLRLYNLTKDEIWASQAQGAAEHALSLNDKLPEVLFALGRVYLAKGNFAGAIAELERGANMAPNSDEGWRRLAQAYDAAGRLKEAEVAYKKGIEANPYNWSTINLLGDFYLRHNRYDDASKQFDEVTKLEPKMPAGWANLGAVAFSKGDFEGAIQSFRKANSLQPDPVVFYDIAQSYYYLQKYAEVNENAQKSLELNPNNQAACGLLADGFRQLGDTEKANALYDKAINLALRDIQVNPRDAVTLGYLAVYYGRRHSEVRALDFIKRALSIDPASPDLFYQEALVNVMFKSPEAAIENLRQAVQNGASTRAIANDPDFKSLGGDHGFQKIVASSSPPK